MPTTFDADLAITTIQKEAAESGLSEAALDEVVHEIASSEAAEVNNSGVSAQITYIITHLGPDGVKQVEDIIQGRG